MSISFFKHRKNKQTKKKAHQKPDDNSWEWSRHKDKNQHRPGVCDGREQHVCLRFVWRFIVNKKDNTRSSYHTDKRPIPWKKKLLRNWDKKANSQKELWSGQINDINNQFYGSIAINDGWWSVISRYFVLCFSLFRKFASVKRKTLFYLNEVAEESYPYRGNVRSKVSVWMFFSAFRTDFRSLPNKTSVSLWQQPATAAFKIPGNIPSTVKPGTPLFFVW